MAGDTDGDADGDGYAGTQCGNRVDSTGELQIGPDCDDLDSAINPGAADGPTMGCDGVDNDCEGAIDVGCSCAADRSCGGAPDGIHNTDPAVCRQGIQRCIDGELGPCEGAIGPGIETCEIERRDDDCNGVPNDPTTCECAHGETRLCGAEGLDYGSASQCRRGTQTCAGGRWQTCEGAVGPGPAEICAADGIDEDCDGSVNEGCGCVDGDEQPCGGSPDGFDAPPATCRRGTQRCVGGTWGACTGAVPPGTETCGGDGIDEDCDGSVNEGCACTDGAVEACGGGTFNEAPALCRRGSRTCAGGAWGACTGAVSPTMETCDALRADEDCDGEQNERCGAIDVCAGDAHSCAVRENGEALCWGANDSGQLGIGSSGGGSPSPVRVTALSDAVEITCGFAFACARRLSGGVVCWGDGALGQLGHGLSGAGVRSSSPTPVVGLVDAVELDAGVSHVCARRGTGQAVCWGDNFHGQLGNGEAGAGRLSAMAINVTGLSTARSISAGEGHSCATRGVLEGVCWGDNVVGQLGDGLMTDRTAPTLVTGGHLLSSVSGGGAHSCAFRSFDLWCWGDNTSGQLGVGTTGPGSPNPVAVAVATEVRQLDAGLAHTCAVLSTGTVTCWGDNNGGQLGDGSTALNQPTPVVVMGLSDAVAVSSGRFHSCALRGAGAIACWGFNGAGQIGDGTMLSPRRTAVAVRGFPE